MCIRRGLQTWGIAQSAEGKSRRKPREEQRYAGEAGVAVKGERKWGRGGGKDGGGQGWIDWGFLAPFLQPVSLRASCPWF